MPLVAARNTEAQGDRALFSIGRSTNRNVLKCEIKLAQRGQPDSEQPVSAYWVMVQLRDRAAFLERIFVKTKEGGAIPKVLYVDLHGRDAATGKAVSERIAN